MKKNVVRIVAALLVAMLALTLIPLGAFAYEERDGVYVQKEYYETKDPSLYDYQTPGDYIETGYNFHGDPIFYEPGSTIKVNDYNNPLIIGNSMYDFAGFVDYDKLSKYADKVFDSQEAFEAFLKNTDVPYINTNISVPKDLTSEKNEEWYQTWSIIFADYVPHQHKLSRWYSDGTTHWRECLVCKNYKAEGFWDQFMYQNWCTDGDEDGICDVCGGDVPYHDVTVIEEEGGKITVNRDNACHRMKITADVEPAEGYKLKKLHFTKVRDNGSKQEITRYKKDGQFWTYMPTYELEVSAEFVKK